MMTRQRSWAAGLALVLAGGSALAATFYWTGGGVDDDWDTTDNWTSMSCTLCYPDDTGDDAYFTDDQCDWGTVELVTDEIGDLSIISDVDFRADTGTPTLTVDRIVVSGTIDCGEVVLTIDGATLEVD